MTTSANTPPQASEGSHSEKSDKAPDNSLEDLAARLSEVEGVDEDLATFESSNYDQRDAEGFIKLNALRLKKNKLKF